jgi:hypothetical protein
MAQDVLTLGNFTFTDFSVPTMMTGGGKQAMVVHKLPGGSRVIDTLGPDEAQANWSGIFFGPTAYDQALVLDAMRAVGDVLPLTWGGQFRWVVIEDFNYRVRRLPSWGEYVISCTVLSNPSLGSLPIVQPVIDTLVLADLAVAGAL